MLREACGRVGHAHVLTLRLLVSAGKCSCQRIKRRSVDRQAIKYRPVQYLERLRYAHVSLRGHVRPVAEPRPAATRPAGMDLPRPAGVFREGSPDDLFETVGVDGPTASCARLGLSSTKTGAVHDRV